MSASSRDPVVLLVDDEEEFLAAMAKALRRRHLEVLTAVDAGSALALLQVHEVDVVVLDVKMPGVDGLEALRQIRREFPDRRVVLLSGQPAEPDDLRARPEGAMEYLMKPVDADHLADTVRRAARQRRTELDAGRAAE